MEDDHQYGLVLSPRGTSAAWSVPNEDFRALRGSSEVNDGGEIREVTLSRPGRLQSDTTTTTTTTARLSASERIHGPDGPLWEKIKGRPPPKIQPSTVGPTEGSAPTLLASQQRLRAHQQEKDDNQQEDGDLNGRPDPAFGSMKKSFLVPPESKAPQEEGLIHMHDDLHGFRSQGTLSRSAEPELQPSAVVNHQDPNDEEVMSASSFIRVVPNPRDPMLRTENSMRRLRSSCSPSRFSTSRSMMHSRSASPASLRRGVVVGTSPWARAPFSSSPSVRSGRTQSTRSAAIDWDKVARQDPNHCDNPEEVEEVDDSAVPPTTSLGRSMEQEEDGERNAPEGSLGQQSWLHQFAPQDTVPLWDPRL